MRLLDGVVDADKHLNDFVIVVVGGQDQRRDVGRKLTLLLGTKELLLERPSSKKLDPSFSNRIPIEFSDQD